MQFKEMLAEQAAQGRLLCAGLDPVIGKIPHDLTESSEPFEKITRFLRKVIEATADIYGA